MSDSLATAIKRQREREEHQPRLPDPSQATCVLSSRCVGYQTEDETEGGIIRRSVWSGIVAFDADLTHPILRYWIDGGGGHVFLSECPRIDRRVPARPK